MGIPGTWPGMMGRPAALRYWAGGGWHTTAGCGGGVRPLFSSAFVGMIGGLGIMYILFSNMEAWKNKDLEECLLLGSPTELLY
jgi:hypothetical protein